MNLFAEWLSLKLEAAGKRAAPHPLKPISVRHKQIQTTPASSAPTAPKRKRKKVRKPRPSPAVSTDVDRWLKSVALLSKDIQDLKKAQEKYKQKQIALDKKRKEKEAKAKRPEDAGRPKPVAKPSNSAAEGPKVDPKLKKPPAPTSRQRKNEPQKNKTKKPDAKKAQRRVASRKTRVNESFKDGLDFLSFRAWLEDVEKSSCATLR